MTLYRRRAEDIRIHHVQDLVAARDWVQANGGTEYVVLIALGRMFLRIWTVGEHELDLESTVGDYIVREATEDFRVYTPEEFNARYEEIGDDVSA
jgi:hypothetical protein